MANALTPTNKALSEQIGINPQSYLEIEGISQIFAALPVFQFTKWDDINASWDDEDIRWDGSSLSSNSLAVIDLSESTKTVTQQIFPDKGGSSSLPSVNISLVDLNNEVAQLLSFDNIGEILGRKADFYIGFKQGSFPEDAIAIYRGIVSDFYTQNGVVMVTVSHPENLKRQAIFQKYISNLTADIDDLVTAIPVVNTSDILPNRDSATTLLRIDDEVVRLVSIDSPTQITVVRAQESTFAALHSDDAEISSIQQLEGEPLELALKIMLSDEDNSYFNSIDLPSTTNFVAGIEPDQPNAFIFDYYNIQTRTGLVVGDLIKINSGVLTGDYTIKSFGTLNNGSYIEVNETLITENPFVGDFTYKSQYNVLPDGLGMLPSNVDVQTHIDIKTQFPSNFVEYKFQLKDTMDNAKEFLDQQVYFPQGLYTITRNARSSVKIVTPPFSSDIVPTIDVNNIINIGELRQRRSLHKYLYNIIRYDYDPDIIEDKFLTKDIVVSSDSITRIAGGKKQMKIESLGLRRSTNTSLALSQITQRVIDRYKFAPTYFEKVNIKYSDGFTLDVGDIVPFGGEASKIIDLNTGKRGVQEQLFEVINKSLNIETGEITVDLLSTSFSITARNAVVSLASGVGSGSTTSRINLVNIVDTGEFLTEGGKWFPFIGQNVRIYKDDYTEDETVVFTGFDPVNVNRMLISPALSFTPTTSHLVEVPEYNDASSTIDSVYKLQFTYLVAQVTITSVTSTSIFDVDDPSKLVVGSEIVVNAPDFTRDSFGTTIIIDSIVGSTVTVSPSLDFTPLIGDLVNNSNFLDGGFPYTII